MAQAKRNRNRSNRRLGLLLTLVGLLLMLFWLGLKGVRAYRAARQGMTHIAALQEALNRSPQDLLSDLDTLQAELGAAAENMATLYAETRFLAPVLSCLGWIPRYGPELAATPHLTAMAADLTGAGTDLADALAPLVPLLEEKQEDALARAAQSLRQQQPLLQRAQARLQHAAYERTFLNPAQLDDGPYAQLGPLLETLDSTLSPATRALGLLNAFLPQTDILLGLNSPQRYLVVGQNNFELRATGGFMGSMGLLTLEKGQITDLDYRRSYDWDNPHREKVQPPLPYVRYMRFGAWFIRDANWYADFPTSAQTIRQFWELDGHPDVEGVIALDLYAVQALLKAIGPLEVPGYSIRVGGSNLLETIWEGYRQDPNFLSALTTSVAQRLQEPDLLTPERLPALLQALGQALEEKHILLYFNDRSLQTAVVEAGWGGAIRDDPGDFLMVVDSDFSYAEVNRFIEQEIRYQVTLDHALKVQESKVTLTYWNHFDHWGSAETREFFGGACFDPETEDLEPFPGCYGDYIRLYVPLGSRFVSAEGFDDGMEYREEAGRTVIAGYVRVLPGQERTVSVTYVPPVGPVGGHYRLTLQKQPGTDALPVEVEVQVVGSTPVQDGLQTDLRTDRVITAMWQENYLVLSGEGLLVERDPEQRERRRAFAEGLELWNNGQQEAALRRWAEADVPDLLLDRVNLLLGRGDLEGSIALAQAVLELWPESARAYFLLGKIHLEAGDQEAARQAWEGAIALEPDNRAARMELGLLYEAQGQVDLAGQHLAYADPDEATPILWQRVWQHLNTGEEEAGLAALGLIIQLNPNDANARFVLADCLRLLNRYDEALRAYEEARRVAPDDMRFYLGRGQLYAAQGEGEKAVADMEAAVTQAPRSAEAWFYLGQYRWRFREDAAGAVAALEQALGLYPNAWYATELGNLHRAVGDLEAAVAAYEQAGTLPGRNAYTWATLGNAYMAQEEWGKAITAYQEALRLAPENASLHAALAQAYEKAGQTEDAIAEYEAALQLEPDNATWREALRRLRE